MALDRSTQPIVKSADGVLVGVAQVRVGRPSIRPASTGTNLATNLTLIACGKSDKVAAASNAAEYVIKPVTDSSLFALNATAGNVNNAAVKPSVTATGTYTGKVDGAYIIRATGTLGKSTDLASTTPATRLEVTDPYGTVTYTPTGLVLGTAVMTASYGITFTAGTFISPQVGDTWIVPVWSGAALNMQQTGIICPFSLFFDATDSIGGLKSASFAPKIDGVKKLESGFPSYVADTIIDKVSVDVSWAGMEYTNTKISLLKQMISRVINTGELSAISVEMVMRTRGGSLVRMWMPTATFTSLPTYAPTNDYSDVSFALSVLKQTEYTNAASVDSTLSTAALATYNAWLSDSPLYSELNF